MSYPGGKSGAGVYQQIINQIPPHLTYIECFYGGGSIMKYKKPAAASIAVDVDADMLRACPPGVLAFHDDAISYLQSQLETGLPDNSVFIYADPPYLKFDIDGSPVRVSARDIYKHEFATVEEHTELLKVLLSLPCMVAVSGYWSSLYESMLHAWRHISFNAQTRSGRTAREFLWMNYPEPAALHDYSYLGSNFREREKITRQKRRWRARLLRMSALQRYALLEAISEFGDAEASLDSAV